LREGVVGFAIVAGPTARDEVALISPPAQAVRIHMIQRRTKH
jgi:hypothetical protein